MDRLLWDRRHLRKHQPGAVKRPSEVIHLGDGRNCYQFYWTTANFVDQFNASGSATWKPHNNGSNFAFMDGHVKWLSSLKNENFAAQY